MLQGQIQGKKVLEGTAQADETALVGEEQEAILIFSLVDKDGSGDAGKLAAIVGGSWESCPVGSVLLPFVWQWSPFWPELLG